MLPLFVETYEKPSEGTTCPVLLETPSFLFEKVPKGMMEDF